MTQTEFPFNYPEFYDQIAEKKFTTLVELGVWRGDSVTHLAKKMLENNHTDFKIYAVDLFEDTSDKDILRIADAEVIKNVHNIFNQKLIDNGIQDYIEPIKSLSWEAADRFEDHSVDFVFIDAGHDYESVKKDLAAWLPKVKEGGIISGHDYSSRWPGVKQAIHERFGVGNVNGAKGSVWHKQL